MAHVQTAQADDARDDAPPALLLAEFSSSGELLHAAGKVRGAGYTQFDAHSPFPIHGMDAAMGLPDSKLGLIVFPIALTGTTLAFLMMWWMNGVDYPLVIGGKPPYSLPSQVPIMFEVTILLSALATVFGMFHLNRLPRHHHPIFNSERFRGFSDDKFFLSIESNDPKWHVDRTKKLLESCHPSNVELLYDDEEGGADFETDAAGGEH
jgi:Protein of unknown function (DUF3341)